MEIAPDRLLLSMGSYHTVNIVSHDSDSYNVVAFLEPTKRHRYRIINDVRGVGSERRICRAAGSHDALLCQPGIAQAH